MLNRSRRLAPARPLALMAAFALLLTACMEDPLVPDSGEPLSSELATPSFSENTPTGDALSSTSDVFPSTNEQNVENGWANVRFVDVGVGTVTLAFEQPRGFLACFEYRADDEDPTRSGDNPNVDVTDGLWTFLCLNGESEERILHANSHVDVRLAFGGERDERFDWTRFHVLSLENRDQCRNGDWQEMGFKNQGQCVRYFETGKDSRAGG